MQVEKKGLKMGGYSFIIKMPSEVDSIEDYQFYFWDEFFSDLMSAKLEITANGDLMHLFTVGFHRILIMATAHYFLGVVDFLRKVYDGNIDLVIGKKLPEIQTKSSSSR